MRASVMAVVAAASVFALSGAAAATLSITGYLPQTGSVTAACDLDGITVGNWTDDGSGNITSVQISNIADECRDSTIVVTANSGVSSISNTPVTVTTGTSDENTSTVSFSGAGFGRNAMTSYTVAIESAP